MQIDFLPEGKLPVPDGDQLIPVINEYIRLFKKANARIIASRDWHPPNHISFKPKGGPWPPHCVQETEGAKFHSDVKIPEGTLIISKATNSTKEAYSVFEGTELAEKLNTMDIDRIFFSGVATDYCIVNSVLDSRDLGFETYVLLDAIKGIEANKGDVEKAIDMMAKSGAELVTSSEFTEPEAFSTEKTSTDDIRDRRLIEVETKRKARMRPRGAYKQIRREKG